MKTCQKMSLKRPVTMFKEFTSASLRGLKMSKLFPPSSAASIEKNQQKNTTIVVSYRLTNCTVVRVQQLYHSLLYSMFEMTEHTMKTYNHVTLLYHHYKHSSPALACSVIPSQSSLTDSRHMWKRQEEICVIYLSYW